MAGSCRSGRSRGALTAASHLLACSAGLPVVAVDGVAGAGAGEHPQREGLAVDDQLAKGAHKFVGGQAQRVRQLAVGMAHVDGRLPNDRVEHNVAGHVQLYF